MCGDMYPIGEVSEMNKLPITFVSVCALCVGISFADTGSDRYEREMAKYKQTDTFENCIRNTSIKNTKVLDSSNIIFEMRDKKVYLNTFDNKCHSLGLTRQFAYKPTNNRLCSFDIISVFNLDGPRGSCGLGKFELLEKLPENES